MAAKDEEDRDDELDADEADEASEDSSDDGEGTSDEDASDGSEEDDDEAFEEDDDDDSDDASDDDADDDDSDDDASDDDDSDADRAADVARALGVGDDEDEDADEAADDDEKKRATNRAERRRQRALRRRRRRQGGGGDDEEDETPKDRNKRKREELLARRRKAAEETDDEDESAAEGLAATELVEDALARGTNAAVKWAQDNWKVLQWIITAGIVGTIGILIYVYQSGKTTTEAADAFAAGLRLEYAVVLPEEDDKRSEEDKARDFRTVYRTDAEKQQAILDRYAKVTSAHAGTPTATLAVLGRAGVLLEKKDWDAAIGAFDEVLGSTLAGTDPDLKARALEGKGFAQEGKGDRAAAMATFTEMAGTDEQLFQLTAKYHQARLHHADGKKDEAVKLLKELREAISKAKIDIKMKYDISPFRWLEREVQDLLVAIDPSAMPPTPKNVPGGGLSPEKLQQMLRERGLEQAIPMQP